ncbi:MAG: hypothetical protein FJ206_13530 [Gemmatimonadetes bacterium]|nr:hypothetical protein [Gemmatimonadota bacterium]
MTEIPKQDLAEVESLLASRQRLADWLDKLEAAGSKTPTAVRERVRSDYRARLAQVVEQLRGHSDVIGSTLQGLRGQASEYSELRSEEQETLAEAELRFTVGEYSDDEWRRVEQDCSGKISGLDDELGRLAGEISRLEDVLRQIAPPPAQPAAPPKREEPVARAAAPEPAPVVRDEPAARIEPAAPAEVPEAPRFVPRGGGLKARDSGSSRTVPFPSPAPKEPANSPVDELTFLKSVTLEGGRATETRTDRPSQTIAKTLKCGECGSLNRPTEWYCERCGAELAAV